MIYVQYNEGGDIMDINSAAEQGEGLQERQGFVRAGAMLVCLQGQDETGLYGKIVNRNLEDAVSFHGIDELILYLDEICDWIGLPQRTAELRFMNSQLQQKFREQQDNHPKVSESGRIGGVELETYVETLRAQEVVKVNIDYRQNASMQGTVCGKITEEQHVAFRSALELMHMFRMISL